MSTTPSPSPLRKSQFSAHVKVLATTDLHGHLLPYDYIKDQPTQGGGLAGLAHLIKSERAQAEAENAAVLLFDNGDTFQGTPLATHLAKSAVGSDHPIAASLNHLQYDALGLGNHDLDHGLPYLKSVAALLDMPLISSNSNGIEMSPVTDSLLLTIYLPAGAPAPLTVGILSALPAQSASWHSHHLGPKATLEDPRTCIARKAKALRKAGADLIFVLAHMGVGDAYGTSSDTQAAHALAACDQIDALILGHTHRRLPSADYLGRAGVDIVRSKVGGVPAVMSGHAGSDLAVMDLTASHDPNTGWSIVEHSCALIPNNANVPSDPAICAIAAKHQSKVIADLALPAATIADDLHSYFSLVSPARTQRLTAQAHYHLMSEALKGRPEADLPLLASAAALGAGGRDGLGNYVHIPKGPVLRRHLVGLTPFENNTVGIRITGAELLQWLTHGSTLFNLLDPNGTDQMLVNPDVPAFQFDTIYGLSYEIDLTAPVHARVQNLTFEGAPLDLRQVFILATSQFRVAGGGGYKPTPLSRVVASVEHPLEQIMANVLNDKINSPWLESPPWKFAPMRNTPATLLTHPDALAFLDDIAELQPRSEGVTSDGFIKLRVTL